MGDYRYRPLSVIRWLYDSFRDSSGLPTVICWHVSAGIKALRIATGCRKMSSVDHLHVEAVMLLIIFTVLG